MSSEENKNKKKDTAPSGSMSAANAKKIMKDMERWAKKQEKQEKKQKLQVTTSEEERSLEEQESVKPGMGLSFGFLQSSSPASGPSQFAPTIVQSEVGLANTSHRATT